MPRPSASKPLCKAAGLAAAVVAGAALCSTVASAAAPAPTAAPAQPLLFDQVFEVRNSPSLQYEARFLGRDGREQRLQAWREGDTRLKRRTGDALEVYAEHRPGDAEYEMTVLDLQSKILTRIGRTNLFRIGNFTDWFDIAHGLRHPRGDYTLTAASAPAGAPAPVAPCRWYALTQGGQAHRICWSTSAQLPLLVGDGQDRIVWRVSTLHLGPVPAGTFRVDARDFVLNDANADIEHD